MNIFYPVFALLALTLAVLIRMGLARYGAVKQREADGRYYELYQGEELPRLRVLSRHYSNLLETPPLFYIACIIAFITGQQGLPVIVLAWAYVALRFLHTFIHLGGNVVVNRFRVFVLSVLVLVALLVVLFVGIIQATTPHVAP
jgi:hypothetical protein